ncbi:double zinc ribbon domain-containing protein [Sandaracinus amylolyticus]|uniref:double zinc ribbon domain-containing protein n=1 Tax=Sandaracinus amylolyticus TaxID=927083 RepID=UPI001F2BC9FE|nr:zinc ribbon domain-containing protein [Sandaracinus amylolyticus]UJR78160.1 DZANK-type domain-containing protein [Sandaracinus amylolyticus]
MQQIPGTVACARCGKALPSLATFCDGCGARVAPIAAQPAVPAVAMPTARAGFVAAGRGMPICHSCGAIAPTKRSSCGTCGAPIGTSLEAVPPRADGAYWVQVRTELTCRQCGRRSPLDALDLDGTVQCGHCGAAQAFDVDAWSEGLAHAHAVGDLAAPSMRGRDVALPGGNPFADIGDDSAHATLETTGMSIENGVMKTRNLALTAAPGQPLCTSCGCPVDVEVRVDEATTRCVGCGERAQYRFPVRAKNMAPGLVAAIGDDLRVDRPDARLDATSAGMVVAVRCPSCGAGLDVPEGAHAARCTYCGTQCRIPSRTLLALKKSPGAAAPWWMLFRGASALRGRLASGGTTVDADELAGDDDDEIEEPQPRRKRKARKHTFLPMVDAARTRAEEAVSWALQIAVPLSVLVLVGITLFGHVVLAWAQGRMSKELPAITTPY